ncbi:hypothetical protein ISS05_05480, partial [Candidatus Woesearchaeota archaeon]|nr:hypothetical protein [Candidatus Woesearchaeota archaeon]
MLGSILVLMICASVSIQAATTSTNPTSVTFSLTEDSVALGGTVHASWSASGTVDHYELNWRADNGDWTGWAYLSDTSAVNKEFIIPQTGPTGVFWYAVMACADSTQAYCTSSFPDGITISSTPVTPAPTCDITLSSSTINEGESTTVTWSSTDATSASFVYTQNGVTSSPESL